MSTACRAAVAANPAIPYHAGSAGWRRATWAAACGGFATFALLYGAQALMPALAAHYRLSPGEASWVLSAATLTMALCMIPMSVLADKVGRTALMRGGLLAGVLLSWLAAASSSYGWLLLWRALFGVVMAGLPALALAYLAEELDGASLGRAVGLYIAGNALGGMCGRYLVAWLADGYGLDTALAGLAGLGSVVALAFWLLLSPSRQFAPRRQSLSRLLAASAAHWRDPALARLFLLGLLLMGAFVSLYNYLGFRLLAAPFGLSQHAIGLIFLLYVAGMAASTVAGRLADRLGRRNVLWKLVLLLPPALWLTLSTQLPLVIFGVALFTFGFFAAHSVAASWVGRRASHARALASAFYLTSYYLGSALVGSGAGLAWRLGAWRGVVAVLSLLLAACLLLCWQLRAVAPRG